MKKRQIPRGIWRLGLSVWGADACRSFALVREPGRAVSSLLTPEFARATMKSAA